MVNELGQLQMYRRFAAQDWANDLKLDIYLTKDKRDIFAGYVVGCSWLILLSFSKGVEVFTVGVGIRQDDKILKEIASEPKSEHFFSTPHPARLTDVLHVIKKKICKGR